MDSQQGVYVLLRYKKKQCVICSKKLKTEEIRTGYGNYWCFEHFSHSEDYVLSCIKCEEYFLKDGFHTTCPRCTTAPRNPPKISGWYWISSWKFCDNCKLGVRLIIVNWMHDWERCPICLIKLPIKDKKILNLLAGIVRKKGDLPEGQKKFEVQMVLS